MSSQVKYTTTIKQGYDPVDGYYYFVDIPDNMLKELGWDEKTKLDAEVKLGTKGNVILISRCEK